MSQEPATTNDELAAVSQEPMITFIEDEIDFDAICEETLVNVRENGIVTGSVS